MVLVIHGMGLDDLDHNGNLLIGDICGSVSWLCALGLLMLERRSYRATSLMLRCWLIFMYLAKTLRFRTELRMLEHDTLEPEPTWISILRCTLLVTGLNSTGSLTMGYARS